MARRLKAMGQAKYQADGDPRTSGPGCALMMHPDALLLPLSWGKPSRVFVNSMSELGHARVPPGFLAHVWATMAATPQHTYQILTKRPGHLRRVLGSAEFTCQVLTGLHDLAAGPLEWRWPLRNVHLGTSIEMDRYSWRADELRGTPAAVRMVSLEPLLGPLPSLDLAGIDWVLIGGESGPAARTMDLGWVRELIGRGHASGAAVFVKQLGTCWTREQGSGGRGGDWDQWPADLRVREFPAPLASGDAA
jgi:protein gp37